MSMPDQTVDTQESELAQGLSKLVQPTLDFKAMQQADGSDVGDTAAPLDVQSTVPITDISPESLVDTATPLESQPAVQGTLETQQQHAAVYAPDSDVSGTDATLAVDSQIGSQDAALGKAAKKGAVSSTSGKSEGSGTASPRQKYSGKLTFTAAPHTPMARKAQRKNFSHTEARLREIKRDNKMMVDRLAHVSTSQDQSSPPQAPAASAGVNRRKAADGINEENFAIFRRLQAVQPSKEIRRAELEREFRVNQQYLQNASHHRGAAPTSQRVETLQL